MECLRATRGRGLALLAGLLLASAAFAAPPPALRLDGYADSEGAISIQHKGDTVDPYFTLQALLLARDYGLDTSAYAQRWAGWLVGRQKLDATFDRFCRNGPVWAPCKTADADDALLAIWLKFLDTMPAELARNPVWQKSYRQSAEALGRLLEPARGIYLVSPVYQHGLFMDNLEVLSYRPPSGGAGNLPDAKKLARDIHRVFWDRDARRFLVSTQGEQKGLPPSFYPDAVAQVFPLLFDYAHLPLKPRTYYDQWMREHRAVWLKQSHADFAWGLIAVAALKQGDRLTAGCWLRETAAVRRSARWIVTDEVVLQILEARGIKPAGSGADCT